MTPILLKLPFLAVALFIYAFLFPKIVYLGPIAQMVVHPTPDRKVGRSSRSGANPFYAGEKFCYGFPRIWDVVFRSGANSFYAQEKAFLWISLVHFVLYVAESATQAG